MKLKELLLEAAEPTDLVTIKAPKDKENPNSSGLTRAAVDLLDHYRSDESLGDLMVHKLYFHQGFYFDGAIPFKSVGRVLEPGKSIDLSKTNVKWNKDQIKAKCPTTTKHYEDEVLPVKQADDEYKKDIKNGLSKEEATANRNKFLGIK